MHTEDALSRAAHAAGFAPACAHEGYAELHARDIAYWRRRRAVMLAAPVFFCGVAAMAAMLVLS
jgi:hypothetical protein